VRKQVCIHVECDFYEFMFDSGAMGCGFASFFEQRQSIGRYVLFLNYFVLFGTQTTCDMCDIATLRFFRRKTQPQSPQRQPKVSNTHAGRDLQSDVIHLDGGTLPMDDYREEKEHVCQFFPRQVG